MAKQTGMDNWPPGTWIGVGLLLSVLAGMLGVATGEPFLLALLAVPGGILTTVGVIALGVDVGLRHRDAARQSEPG